ncbi:MAG: isochorismatase family protein, partial [Planctomycetaceae bacterium]|nr:isochorismatase family protein [Planctomycetaceae bacterium]
MVRHAVPCCDSVPGTSIAITQLLSISRFARQCCCLVLLSGLLWSVSAVRADSVEPTEEALKMQLTFQRETSPASGRFHRLVRDEVWQPEQTAIIVCDVWDYHHCLNAVRRVEQFAPRLAAVLDKARSQGVTIIHAPSDCMAAYTDHPARHRAQQAPAAAYQPPQIEAWCSKIPSEERGVYPIDQSDGGEDDDPQEHADWAARLEAMGRNPQAPWKMQSSLIPINAETDYISDKGNEVWNVLEQRGIRNVILAGVHTNMCVLGRPFGLRQLARNGKNVVL